MKNYKSEKFEETNRDHIIREKLEKIVKLEKKYRENPSHSETLKELIQSKDFLIDHSSEVTKATLLNILLVRHIQSFIVFSSNRCNDFYSGLADVYQKDIFEILSFLIRSSEEEISSNEDSDRSTSTSQ